MGEARGGQHHHTEDPPNSRGGDRRTYRVMNGTSRQRDREEREWTNLL